MEHRIPSEGAWGEVSICPPMQVRTITCQCREGFYGSKPEISWKAGSGSGGDGPLEAGELGLEQIKQPVDILGG